MNESYAQILRKTENTMFNTKLEVRPGHPPSTWKKLHLELLTPWPIYCH